jgi:NADH:ubiquinone oxidoreductase subunit
MGSDKAGNRYYENRVDYTFGMHRWVEPGDIHNFDSSSIDPEWHGWMTSMNDDPPCSEEEYIAHKTEQVEQMCRSDAPAKSNVGHQEEYKNFHNLHNQTSIRSRGYGIGNPIVGLPPNVKDAYYTQPGSPYNDASIRPLEFIGSLDNDGGRKYKSEKWAERLRTDDEKAAIEAKNTQGLHDILSGGSLGIGGNSRGNGTVVGSS